MQWEPDVARGAWLAERVDARWGDMHVAVPRGFEAYARVFHPIEADRPLDKAWAEIGRRRAPWRGAFELRTATWSEVAGESGAVASCTGVP